ncbi:hypothetical protein D3C85_751680 [compost metagenome]
MRCRVGQAVTLLAFASAHGGPDRDGVGHVELAAQGAEQLGFVGIGPGLGEILVGGRRRWNGAGGRDLRTRRVDAVVLPSQVGGEAGAIAAAIQAEAQNRHGATFALDRAFARAAGQVQTQAPGVVLPKAARNIRGGVDLVAAFPPGGQTSQGRVARALGHKVDRAAHAAAAGRGAVQEGGRPPKDLDPLQQLRRHVLARQHAVEAVIGHVVREDREAADDVEFLEVAKAFGDADRRIVLQHVGDAAGLLVADQVFGEAGRGEGRVHGIQRSEHPDPSARGHLTAGIGGGQGNLRSCDDDVGKSCRHILLRPGRRGVDQGQTGDGCQEAEQGRAHRRLALIIRMRRSTTCGALWQPAGADV